jgi:hypothetical protein
MTMAEVDDGAWVCERIRAETGLCSKIGAEIGRTRQAVFMWRRVPSVHVRAVARVTGLPPHVIRPDLYDPPTQSGGPVKR